MNRDELNNLLEKGAERLDITPTMFEEAKTHYGSVGEFLGNNGIDADIYPFGSIATGTVTRPYTEDEDDYFDIDVAVRRDDCSLQDSSPDEVRDPVADALRRSGRYSGKLDESDECITVLYVSNGVEGGFRLDLNVCIENENGPGSKAADCATYPEYSAEPIAIARKDDRWLDSNPRGLVDWFNDKNRRFAAVSSLRQKERIQRDHPSVYASIEDVPDILTRTSLQRAVQILKRSSRVYYRTCRWDGPQDTLPSSCMINVLCANVSDSLPDEASIMDVLEAFVGLCAQPGSAIASGTSAPIGSSGAWRLDNPVYAGNLLEGWTDNDARRFFSWVESLASSLNDLFGIEQKREAALSHVFGNRIAGQILPAAVAPAVIKAGPGSGTASQPWRSFLG